MRETERKRKGERCTGQLAAIFISPRRESRDEKENRASQVEKTTYA